MRRIKTLAPGMLAGLALTLAAPGLVLAQDSGGAAEFHATTLNLSAQGQVQATPDLAVIRLGVQTEGATAALALARNRAQMGATVDAPKGQGVPDRDIQTSGLSLDSQYQDDGKSPHRLIGYQVSNTVTVRLHELPKIGAVVDALVAAGANHVDGISFALSDPQTAEDQARGLAIKALQAKADLYAKAMGFRISRLVRLSENGGYSPNSVSEVVVTAVRFRRTPVEPGELTVNVGVSAEFELAR
ncbi:MAG: SIMPL domain-containing protein [Caulobacteraceae bacterium]